MFDLPGFVCVGSNLSYTDRILHANINSAGDCEAGVLLFPWRNCWRAFSVSVDPIFIKSLFKVSTNRPACLLDRGWNGAVVTWSIWVWFVEVFELSRCKLASIVRHYGVYSHQTLWTAHEKISWWFLWLGFYIYALWETVDYNEIVNSFLWVSEVSMYPRPWKVCLWPGLNLIGNALPASLPHSLTAFSISLSMFDH